MGLATTGCPASAPPDTQADGGPLSDGGHGAPSDAGSTHPPQNIAPVIDPDGLLVPLETLSTESLTLVSIGTLYERGIIVDEDTPLADLRFELRAEHDAITIDWDGDLNTTPLVIPTRGLAVESQIVLCVFDGSSEVCRGNPITVTNPCLEQVETHSHGAERSLGIVMRHDYDERLRRIRTDQDRDGDEVPDRITHWQYNEDHQPTVRATDADGDGDLDKRFLWTYTEEGWMATAEDHEDAEGTVHRRYTYRYDARGNQVQEDSEEGDGTNVYRATTTYNDRDQPLVRELDRRLDGELDARTTWSYGDDGRILSEAYDGAANGTVNRQKIYHYHEEGRLLRLEETETLANDAIRRVLHHYDEQGDVIRVERDLNGDGAFDVFELMSYDERRLIERVVEQALDGAIDERTTYTYGEHDQLLRRDVDREDNGIIDWRTDWTWTCQ